MPDLLFDVRDRVVVITGGLGQLGSRFGLALLQRGARVAVFELTASAELAAKAFGEYADHANLNIVEADVTSRPSLEAGLKAVRTKWETPFGLINTAALDSPPGAPIEGNGPFETYPESSWDSVMAVNVKGTMMACQVIGGAMAEAGRGSIVAISSTYGLVSPDQRIYDYRRQDGEEFYKPASYSASKSALLNLTRYMATYWADHGVRANTLSLGGVFNSQDERFLEGYQDRVPMRRMADENEYNGAVVFLMSDASSYMTGANLVIDGGWTAW